LEFLLSVVRHITVADIIDISIVAFIVYRFLLIIQGTRSIQMLVGLSLLGSLYWLSVLYKLSAVNWMLEHFFDYIILILIILFQDHIRSALILTPFFSSKRSPGHLKSIEEVVAGAKALQKEKVGALMVFQKKQGLQHFVETGTRLDANLHSDLIYSLFQKQSPLHDGAIIISKNRILAAGCFLPLTKHVEIDRHLGSRHRAALGLSELSDAICLIISEESGRMNMAQKGRLIHIKDIKTLRKVLQKSLLEDAAPSILPKIGEGEVFEK